MPCVIAMSEFLDNVFPISTTDININVKMEKDHDEKNNNKNSSKPKINEEFKKSEYDEIPELPPSPPMRSGSLSKPKTSMEVFMKHVKYNQDGSIDVSGIFEIECYKEWLSTRKGSLRNGPLTFIHTLRSHINSSEKTGRQPFPEAIETQMLKVIRKKEIWPCFQALNREEGQKIRYGSRGMMSVRGYHERKAEERAKGAVMHPVSAYSYSSSSSSSSPLPAPLLLPPAPLLAQPFFDNAQLFPMNLQQSHQVMAGVEHQQQHQQQQQELEMDPNELLNLLGVKRPSSDTTDSINNPAKKFKFFN